MPNEETHREKFERFLGNVDLGKYREKYRPVKLVEMDLPKNIQALALLYKVYWEERRFIDYSGFYAEYLKEKYDDLEEFREKIGMCGTCFYKGLPARIYRTWASIITQIQGAYVAESVFGSGTVTMSEQLDHQGADFRVIYKRKILNYQVSKESQSREVRAEKTPTKKVEGEFIELPYLVPPADVFENPKKLNGELKLPYKRFMENKNLKRLSNGFVIFTPFPFEIKKKDIDLS